MFAINKLGVLLGLLVNELCFVYFNSSLQFIQKSYGKHTVLKAFPQVLNAIMGIKH
jgi:hypothetical protein